MLVNSKKISEMSDSKFEELITLVRYSALNASELSSNVAISFLSNMLKDSKVYGPPNYEVTNEEERRFIDLYGEERMSEDHGDTSSVSPKSRKFSRVSSIRARITRIMSLFRLSRKNSRMDSKAILEPESVSKREKFYISYADLMVPSTLEYDPKRLDIPIYDFRRSSLSFSESIEIKIATNDNTSEVPEPKPYPLLLESNTLFRQKHPWLHPTLSFTKLCKIKYNFMLLPNLIQHVDPSTSAIAWTLFERLVLNGIITKFNRKLFSSVCYIIAYKFNQDFEYEVINEILTIFKREKNVDGKSIFYNEMKIFALLDFSLKLKYTYIQTHINHYLDFNKTSFFELYDTPESTYTMLELD
ncbi:cyclin-like protein, putative [Theileria annulata]|uniref:Cyclin-like protein, putative n=1 Tax=Theileria annulata TaxID=5874 RepID=Q4UDP0_THEAN|nr:cyclin-like protein, putative [Theileria annulata]CAI74799.1 cyclin-like protein, putative [Theileria annulata]|eukprot:XP_952531.1 cyclin-like protein, putative [Theileria annulata]